MHPVLEEAGGQREQHTLDAQRQRRHVKLVRQRQQHAHHSAVQEWLERLSPACAQQFWLDGIVFAESGQVAEDREDSSMAAAMRCAAAKFANCCYVGAL